MEATVKEVEVTGARRYDGGYCSGGEGHRRGDVGYC